jgi:hypothetical protein
MTLHELKLLIADRLTDLDFLKAKLQSDDAIMAAALDECRRAVAEQLEANRATLQQSLAEIDLVAQRLRTTRDELEAWAAEQRADVDAADWWKHGQTEDST